MIKFRGLVFLNLLLCAAASTNKSEATAAEDPGRLTVHATVVLPNGEPAVQATVTSHNNVDDLVTTATTDGNGRVEISDVFLSMHCGWILCQRMSDIRRQGSYHKLPFGRYCSNRCR
ncbi:MAG: carboxypeptidase-like regulatory domain-containing protein [Planctomycetota bacterium]|nr:carboxypeptidase-like regulatory domain-containing protein [Planctomycetota bacterium]